MTVLGFGGVFVVFTYIAPILEQVSGFSPRGVTLMLVLFGVGLTIGNTIGGKLADRALMPSLMGILVALAVVMAIFARTSHCQMAAAITIFVWGVAAFATVPPLQTRVVEKAAKAPNLASTLEHRRVQCGQCRRRVARRLGDRPRIFARYAAVGRGGGKRGGLAADVVCGAFGCACLDGGAAGLLALSVTRDSARAYSPMLRGNRASQS